MINFILPTLGDREKEFKRLLNSLEKQTDPSFRVIVASQNNHQFVEETLNSYSFSYKHIQLNKRGLSYARNEALKYVQEGIVTFPDDDCWYPPNSIEKIRATFGLYNVKVACFKIFDPIKQMYYKKYQDKIVRKLRPLYLLKRSSIEIFININNVDKKDIQFDERFGLGTMIPSGEENILLNDLYRKGYSIEYFPETVVFHRCKSTKRLDEISILSKGPVFRRIFGKWFGGFLLLLFFIRKIKFIDDPVRLFIKAIKQS